METTTKKRKLEIGDKADVEPVIKKCYLIETNRSLKDEARAKYLIESNIYEKYNYLTSLLIFDNMDDYRGRTAEEKTAFEKYDAIKEYLNNHNNTKSDDDDDDKSQQDSSLRTPIDYWFVVIDYLKEHNQLIDVEDDDALDITIHLERFVDHYFAL
jgi:hypothetical protein